MNDAISLARAPAPCTAAREPANSALPRRPARPLLAAVPAVDADAAAGRRRAPRCAPIRRPARRRRRRLLPAPPPRGAGRAPLPPIRSVSVSTLLIMPIASAPPPLPSLSALSVWSEITASACAHCRPPSHPLLPLLLLELVARRIDGWARPSRRDSGWPRGWRATALPLRWRSCCFVGRPSAPTTTITTQHTKKPHKKCRTCFFPFFPAIPVPSSPPCSFFWPPPLFSGARAHAARRARRSLPLSHAARACFLQRAPTQRRGGEPRAAGSQNGRE